MKCGVRSAECGKLGFTLLEIIIASLLLAWIVVGMFNLYTVSQAMLGKANRVRQALALARDKLEEFSGVGFDAFGSGGEYEAYLSRGTTIEDRTNIGIQNEFIDKYFKRRLTTVVNQDDWDKGGEPDYRKIEVKVEWDEPS